MALFFKLDNARVRSNIFLFNRVSYSWWSFSAFPYFLLSESCVEKSTRIALLSILAGYILPNPKLWAKWFLPMTGSSCQLIDQLVVVKQRSYFAFFNFRHFISASKHFLQLVPPTFQTYTARCTRDWVSKILKLWYEKYLELSDYLW